MPKLLFDQNLSYKVVELIEHLFPGSSHVRLLKLEKADDMEIWEYAKKQSFTIVTQDADFNDKSALYGFPPKVIRIRTGNTSTHTIINLIQQKAEIIEEFLQNSDIGLLELKK